MGDYEQLYNQGLYLSPGQQDLLMAALHSNAPANKHINHTPQVIPDHSPDHSSNGLSGPPSGALDSTSHLNPFGNFGDDESPYLDFDPGVDFDYTASGDLIGDLPGGPGQDYESGGKRKSIDGKSDEGEDTGKKRRESEAKKPGRKPLTSEPTTVCFPLLMVTSSGGRYFLTQEIEA